MTTHSKNLHNFPSLFVISMTFFSAQISYAETLITTCSPEMAFSESASPFRDSVRLGASVEKIFDQESMARSCGRDGESRNALYSKREVEAWAKKVNAQKIFSSPADLNAVIDEVIFMGSRPVGEVQALPAFQVSVLLKKGKNQKFKREEFLETVRERILERLPSSERANFLASLQGKECP